MRRFLAAVCLVLLRAPDAYAQFAPATPVRNAPTPAEIVAQATFDTSYLLAGYMMQLAAAGTPPTQADIEEAARQYLTNGAAVVGVPASGPRAAYFREGASVTSVPTSGPAAAYFRDGAGVMAYQRFSAPPNPTGTTESAFDAGTPPTPEAGSVPADAAIPEEAALRAVAPPPDASANGESAPSAAVGLTSSPLEIQAAIAIAGQFAAAAARGSAPSSTPPSIAPPHESAPVHPLAEVVTAREASPSVQCRPMSLISRLAPALGGALFGGLVVALWSRPRLLRAVRRR